MNPAAQRPSGPHGDTPDVAGFSPLPGRQLFLALVGIMLAMFTSALSQTVIVTAMPQVIVDLGGFDRYTWGSTAYLLGSIIATPIAGRLNDIYGPRIFFIVGGAVFIIGTIFGGLSQTMAQVIISRGIQGVGGGIMMISCFVAIAYLLPPQQRARWQGVLSGVLALAWVIGPPLGGAVSEGLSWRWVFWLNVPLGVAIIILIMGTFPRITFEVKDRRLDYPGMLTLTAAVGLLALGLSLGGAYHAWGSPLIIAMLALGAAMLLAFVAIQFTSEAPMMPFEIYRIRMVSTCVAASLITGFGLYATMMLTPLALQVILHLSPTGAGGLFTPLLVSLIMGAFASGQLLSITGPRYRIHALVGAVLMVVGLYSISTLHSETPLAQVAVFVSVYGFGTGVILATTTVAVQNSVPHSVLGASTAALHFYRQVGGLLGLSLLGALLTQRFTTKLDLMLADAVSTPLPAAQLDAVKKHPHALIDPDAGGVMMPMNEGTVAEQVLHTVLHDTLSMALREVFLVAAAVAALCLLAVIFIHAGGGRAPAGDLSSPVGDNSGRPSRDNRVRAAAPSDTR